MNTVCQLHHNNPRQQRPDWMLTNYDRKTTIQPDVDSEIERLTVLRSFSLLLSQETDPDFEVLSELAMSLLETPMACVKLVDLSRVHIVASAGAWPKGLTEISRQVSFCGHTIQSREPLLIVKDTLQDDRFCDNPHVTGGGGDRDYPHIRFYAGAPLVTSEGAKVGTLCVFDTQPRPQGLTKEQCDHLLEIAKLAVDVMETSRKGKRSIRLNSNKGDALQPTDTAMTDMSRSKSLPCYGKYRTTQQQQQQHYHQDAESQRRHSMFDKSHSTTTQPQPILLMSFIRGLKIAMEAFPKQVDVQFVMDSSCPVRFIADELPMFRAAVAVLTSACERTEQGFIRMTVRATKQPGHHNKNNNSIKTMMITCEDTGLDLDPAVDIFGASAGKSPAASDALDAACFQMDTSVTGTLHDLMSWQPVGVTERGVSLQPVRQYMKDMRGEYGYRPRNAADGTTGSIVWFSFPISFAP
jgi:hypothetical protein